MRWVMVVVLPVPAPARMTTGPRVAVTASRWASFSPARMASSRPVLTGPMVPGGTDVSETGSDSIPMVQPPRCRRGLPPVPAEGVGDQSDGRHLLPGRHGRLGGHLGASHAHRCRRIALTYPPYIGSGHMFERYGA